jgi:hypothetical protein
VSDDTLTAAQDAARRFGKGTGSQEDLQKALAAHTAAAKKPAAKKPAAKATPAKAEDDGA